MAAIAGIVGMCPQADSPEKMLKTMERRGSAAKGAYFTKGCVLLNTSHVRTGIHETQIPLHVDCFGSGWTIVYDGVLYNKRGIYEELQLMGHHFSGQTDGEIIVRAYCQWGTECLLKFNGVFAFAIWNAEKQELFAARDRMGVRPFFYMQHRNGLLFSSEIKTILACPDVKPEIDATGIAELILIGPGRVPGSGTLKGIRELMPGCWGKFHSGKWEWKRYWSLQDRTHIDSFPEATARIRYLIEDAVRMQTAMDRPTAAFLSGGLDSSILCALCAKNQKNTLQTFSIDFTGNQQNFIPDEFQGSQDAAYAAIMENYLRTNGRRIVISTDEQLETLEDAVCARDLPGMADIDASMLIACREIRSQAEIVLSGECADELFGGYPWYRNTENDWLINFPWMRNLQQRKILMDKEISEQIKPEEYIRNLLEMSVCQADILPGCSEKEKKLKQMMHLNMIWFMQTLLERTDRMSMYSGLEVRVPFCDYRIAQYMYEVPWNEKFYGGREKGILREAVRDLLPQEILNRKKCPYPKTYDIQYSRALESRLDEILTDSNAPLYGIIRKEGVRTLLQSTIDNPWYGQLMRKPQIIGYLLQMNMWMQHYGVSVTV